LNADPALRKMVLKSRQFGVSTSELLKCYDFTIFTPNVTTVILAHDNASIVKLFRIIARAHKYMHPAFQPELGRGGGSKYEMYFPGMNSRIYCGLQSRGDTIHKLHVSEMAFMKNKERLDATLQAVPLNGQVGIESTPYGMNHFYDDWNDPNSVYKKFFFPWYLHYEYVMPLEKGERKLVYTADEQALRQTAYDLFKVRLTQEQIKWRRFKMRESKLFIQEYPEDDVSCFLASGNSAMDLSKLAEMKLNVIPGHKLTQYLTVFKQPEAGRTYVIGADTAEGIGSDYSVACVLDKETREQVAVLRGHIKPKQFAEALYALGKMFSNKRSMPLLAVERNNHGHAVLLWLEDTLKYTNLFTHDDDRVGWKTTSATRPILFDSYIDAVENELMKLNSINSINESMTLIDNNGKIEAMDGKHDDECVANAIALQMTLEKEHFLKQMLRKG